MKFSVPIYCEKFIADGGEKFMVRPLFFSDIESVRPELKRAADSVADALRKQFRALANEARHDALAQRAFSPDLHESQLRLRIELKRRTFEAAFLFAEFEAGGRKVAYTPRLPGLTFEVARGETLADRAAKVLHAWYAGLERDEREFDAALDGIRGNAWLSHVDFSVDTTELPDADKGSKRAEIGGFGKADGAAELARVGRNLNDLHPEGLSRALHREHEVSELQRLLTQREARPVMLLGGQGVGKTAVLHEALRRMIDNARDTGGRERGRNVWLVSPQRLISGMSFVGQWEDRVHAIVQECIRRGHVLYFDDVVGLFYAGISANSKLTVAQVVKPHIEARKLRVVAEMTPASQRILAELDRSFADLFHVIPVAEPGRRDNAAMLVHLARELEARHEVAFTHEVLPTVLDLTGRYYRDQAWPGKAAAFLERLALRHRGGAVGRQAVLQEFEARSGLRVSFSDDRARLPRAEVVEALQRRVIGQHGAVAAMADAVTVAKARLNDPARPLGTFLFLGPTGVGKTECAKALAQWMFGDEARLIRFDMAEFGDPYSVHRLAGSPAEPDGLLTSAVRRQPFAVVLLDEIEKAHPMAFDLLLQVLGEARLTDARGRTTDFSNCVIIMTSNLGASETEGGIGLGGHAQRGEQAYTDAARRFFRPEFFNRIDRIVPFARLSRDEVGRIARLLLDDVFRREGLARRRCVLQVDSAALERVIDSGYHPQLGARAIRREIERELTRPLAARLAALSPDVPALIRLMAGPTGMAVQLMPLRKAHPVPRAVATLDFSDADAVVARMDSVLNRADEMLEALRPQGAVTASLTPQQRRYFALKQQAEFLDNAIERFLDWRDGEQQRRNRASADSTLARASARAKPATRELVPVAADAWLKLESAAHARALLAGTEDSMPELESRLRKLAGSAAMLDAMLRHEAHGDDHTEERALLFALPEGADAEANARATLLLLTPVFRRLELGAEYHFTKQGAGLEISGYLAHAMAQLEAGTSLWCGRQGLQPVSVHCMPLQPGQSVPDALTACRAQQRDFAAKVQAGEAAPDDAPFAPGPVLRVIYDEPGTPLEHAPVLDARSGMLLRESGLTPALANLLLHALPLGGEA